MQLPSRRAYHVIYDNSLHDALRYAHNNNWTGIVPDLSVPRFFHSKYSESERNELRRLSTECSIEWGFHTPGDDVSLFTAYTPIREAILSHFKGIIDFARSVSTGPTNIVVHCGKPPSFRKAGGQTPTFQEEYHEFYSHVLRENLLILIEYGKDDVKVVLENLSWTSLVHEVIETLIPKGLRLCIDVPKLFTPDLQMKEADWETFKKYRLAIEVVHLHDMSEELKSHQVIGVGNIDFGESFRFLSGIKQPLQYVMEVRPRKAATESLIALEKLLKDLGISLR